jgi:hypothetical protein
MDKDQMSDNWHYRTLRKVPNIHNLGHKLINGIPFLAEA